MNGVIYCYTSPSGKQYVGQTTNEKRRKQAHSLAETTGPFHQAVRKYGYLNMAYEVLHSGVANIEELNRLEQAEIERLNCITPNGYNLDSGGKNFFRHESTKQKIREKAFGRVVSEETRKKLVESHLGYVHTEEQKEKISHALKGKSKGAAFREKMKEVRNRPELREQARQTRLGAKTAPEALKNLRENHATTPILCVTTGKVYKSIKEASEDTGINRNSIALSARNKVVGRKYRWEYV